MLKATTALLALIASASLARADNTGTVGDCPHPPKHAPQRPAAKKPHAPTVAPAPAPAPVPTPPTPCSCLGLQGNRGDIGPSGPVGPAGPPGRDGERGNDGGYLQLRIGVMGALTTSGHSNKPDWAWGPALELEGALSRHDALVIDLGLAYPLDGDPSPGRQDGALARIGVTHDIYMRRRHSLALTGGVDYLHITGADAGVHDLSLDVGIVFRQRLGHRADVRLQAGPTFGGQRYAGADDTRFEIGAEGSVFFGVAL